jgi:GPH family glycoside/pentoside/hexuronide:cation symporter
LQHRSFVIYTILNTFFLALAYCILASIPYAVRYILKESSSAQILLQMAFLIGVLISTPFWIKFANKVNDNRKVLIISSSLIVILTVPFSFLTDVIFLFISIFCWGMSYGGMWALMRVCIADVIDESVAETRKRKEGVYNGINQFFSKMAIIIQALIFAVVHMSTGFDESASKQSPEAIWGIQLHFGIVPALLLLIGLIIFWKWYPLTPEKLKSCQEKIVELGL